MATLLHITTSIFGDEGQSSQLAQRYVDRWQTDHPNGRVLLRDLDADPVPHLTAERFRGFLARPEDRTPAQVAATREANALIDELMAADTVVLGLPMYNFSIPSGLKAYFDHVARSGVTFRYTESGPVGLVGDKPVFVFAARGGQYRDTELDTQTPLVRTFLGFLGMQNVRFVYAEGLALGEAPAGRALAAARAEIDALPV